MGRTIQTNAREREWALDWLTALSPVLLMGFLYFRWAVLALVTVAAGAHLAMEVLLGRRLCAPRAAVSLVSGVMIALCLPSTAPVWTAALAGGVAALVARAARLPRHFSRPAVPVCAPLVGYVLVRLAFPASVTDFPMPVQWMPLDGVSGATPLAGLWGSAQAVPTARLAVGLHPGAIGEGCVAVVLLAALYLLLRRRLRLIAPAAMLATVALLSWLIWGAPVYSLLAGGTVLAALLLADRASAPACYGCQAVAGVLAGGVAVLLRAVCATDGTGVGVVLACSLSPGYPALLRGCRRAAVWLWVLVRRYAHRLGVRAAVVCRAIFKKLGTKLKIRVDKSHRGKI